MIYLENYVFRSDGFLEILFSNGEIKLIQFTEDSGRIVTRKKIGSISNINHPGIYMGKDIYSGEVFILHNHYKAFQTAGVSPFYEYAAEEKVYWDNRICVNNKKVVLQKGLDQAIKREKYHWLTYNCQITVNDACSNRRVSEDVGKWFGRVALGFVAFVIVGAIAR